MHWVDLIAEELLERGRRHTVASGISISGHIHIGHANDVFIADAIAKVLRKKGADARAIWYADDYDPMRRVPSPLNENEFGRYLGYPYVNIPSPDPAYRSFVDYFSRPFIESLKSFGIEVEIFSAAEIYRSGMMSELIRIALQKSEKIRKILNMFRETPLPDDWLPFDPLCENCGRISTTRAIDWHGDFVRYRCEGASYVEGCGHEGEADYTKGEGKLTWRVEWPARWKLLGVTCEPFGKDHAAAGGSYDTGRLIAREVFECEPPYPVPYEWVAMGGEKLSSSKGVVFTLKQWLEVAEPELLRYFIFRSKPMKAKEFNPSNLPDLYDEYDLAERVYFGEGELPLSRVEQVKRIYELSQVDGLAKKKPQRVPFRFAAVLCQIKRSEEETLEILKSRGLLVNPDEDDIRRALLRLRLARRWVELYAPEHLKFEILTETPSVKLDEKQREGLRRLAEIMSHAELGPVELHTKIYELAREIGLDPPKLFEAIYLAFLGRPSGPRAGAFLSALDRRFVVERLFSLAG
ncbi:MAG: lysine--tRNA ligase [Candidatus Hadarchaeales archaeon]